MNIYLIPFTWIRHLAPALIMGSATLILWWFWLTYLVVYNQGFHSWFLLYSHQAVPVYFMSSLAGLCAGLTIFYEGSLYRTIWYKRFGFAFATGFGTWLMCLLQIWLARGITYYIFTSETMAPLASDSSLTTLRYRILMWIACGFWAGVGPLVARRGKGALTHMTAGLLAGGVAAAVWHWLGYQMVRDYYLASAMAAFSFGIVYGLFIWPIPRDLYAGWVRVLSDHRFPYRIPIDHIDGSAAERFIGHFPRGLDLFLPVEQGVAELHISVLVDRDQNYAVRGLSVWPTITRRFLERIDLRYDPSRPAPLQTLLSSGDRITMSDGVNETHVEFVMLPKEER